MCLEREGLEVLPFAILRVGDGDGALNESRLALLERQHAGLSHGALDVCMRDGERELTRLAALEGGGDDAILAVRGRGVADSRLVGFAELVLADELAGVVLEADEGVDQSVALHV